MKKSNVEKIRAALKKGVKLELLLAGGIVAGASLVGCKPPPPDPFGIRGDFVSVEQPGSQNVETVKPEAKPEATPEAKTVNAEEPEMRGRIAIPHPDDDK